MLNLLYRGNVHKHLEQYPKVLQCSSFNEIIINSPHWKGDSFHLNMSWIKNYFKFWLNLWIEFEILLLAWPHVTPPKPFVIQFKIISTRLKKSHYRGPNVIPDIYTYTSVRIFILFMRPSYSNMRISIDKHIYIHPCTRTYAWVSD